MQIKARLTDFRLTLPLVVFGQVDGRSERGLSVPNVMVMSLVFVNYVP